MEFFCPTIKETSISESSITKPRVHKQLGSTRTGFKMKMKIKISINFKHNQTIMGRIERHEEQKRMWIN